MLANGISTTNHINEDADPMKKSKSSTPDTYEVGYKRPPRKHQFKKRKSGNPKGIRFRKVPKSFEEQMAVLQEEKMVTIEGQNMKMPVSEIMIRNGVSQANSGRTKLFTMMLKHPAEFSRLLTIDTSDAAYEKALQIVEFRKRAREYVALKEGDFENDCDTSDSTSK